MRRIWKTLLSVSTTASLLDRLLEEEENDAPFPDLDLSGTWDLGMQTHPNSFMPQRVDEICPISNIMMGVDLPTTGTLLPLRDVSMAGGC